MLDRAICLRFKTDYLALHIFVVKSRLFSYYGANINENTYIRLSYTCLYISLTYTYAVFFLYLTKLY